MTKERTLGDNPQSAFSTDEQLRRVKPYSGLARTTASLDHVAVGKDDGL